MCSLALASPPGTCPPGPCRNILICTHLGVPGRAAPAGRNLVLRGAGRLACPGPPPCPAWGLPRMPTDALHFTGSYMSPCLLSCCPRELGRPLLARATGLSALEPSSGSAMATAPSGCLATLPQSWGHPPAHPPRASSVAGPVPRGAEGTSCHPVLESLHQEGNKNTGRWT